MHLRAFCSYRVVFTCTLYFLKIYGTGKGIIYAATTNKENDFMFIQGPKLKLLEVREIFKKVKKDKRH